jgi:signal transduction histidine kinase
MRDEEGKPLRIIGTHTDIAYHKLAEEELRKAKDVADETNFAKSRFLSVVAHEFNTPLGLLSVSVDILDRYWDRLSKEQRAEQHEQIRSAARQMTHLIDSVFSFNNQEPTVSHKGPMLLDVGQICRSIAEEVKYVWGAYHEFDILIAPDCGTSMLDEDLFRRLLSNLLTNAFRFTPPGGTVSLSVNRLANRLKIEVADTGIGIPGEEQKRVFEAFYRSSNVDTRSGLGLGLSIVSEVLQQMNGSITMISMVGEGTTFRVELPLNNDFITEEQQP